MPTDLLSPPRVAFVHDWLVVYAGAERVLEQMLECFPEADIFSLIDFLAPEQRGFIRGKQAKTSFLQRMPGARTRYRSYLPLMPIAIEQLDLSGYDIIVSSSHAVAKGVLVGPDQLHICMCYSPIRYAWDLQNQYLQESGLVRGPKSWLARWLLHKVRNWDSRTANGVDHFIAISHFIARRIEKAYRRRSTVIYPPVDTSAFVFRPDKEEFYLTASRMVPYKKKPTIVEAFAHLPDRKLVVIGDGPDLARCRQLAGPNVELLGWQSFDVLKDHMQRAKAFIFAAEEDFGIAPLEAQACGTPVIAYGKGAALETIRCPGSDDGPATGIFFQQQTSEAIAAAIREFEQLPQPIDPIACRQNALRFSPERFRDEFDRLVRDDWRRFQAARRPQTLSHAVAA